MVTTEPDGIVWGSNIRPGRWPASCGSGL